MTRDLWSGPIVDAHQHFWDPIANDHPWLRPDARIAFRLESHDADR
jgi:predicted TIM-barrel fold metal-dependent hydrolase